MIARRFAILRRKLREWRPWRPEKKTEYNDVKRIKKAEVKRLTSFERFSLYVREPCI